MQYIFEIFIPVLILGLSYVFAKIKPKVFSEWVSFFFNALLHEWGYAFFVYYLGAEKSVDTGWAFVTLILLLTPTTAIVILLKVFYWFKLKRS